LLGISIFHWCWVPGKKLGTPNRLLVFKNKLNVMQDKLDSHEKQNAYCTGQAGATIGIANCLNNSPEIMIVPVYVITL